MLGDILRAFNEILSVIFLGNMGVVNKHNFCLRSFSHFILFL